METELAKISKLAFDNMYGNREISNISTYCKNKLCWERLRDMAYNLSDNVNECLISNEDRTIDMTRAKKEQRSDSNLNFALEIFKKGENYWENLINKSTEQKTLSQHEIELLQIAKSFTKNGKLVSEKQAASIFKIVEQLKQVGIE